MAATEPEWEDPTKGKRYRGWVFTYYEQNGLDLDGALNEIRASRGHKYVVAGKEVCPKTGRPHLQGYVYWSNGKTPSAAHKWLPKGCWIAVARSDGGVNRAYCTKDGDFYEDGETPKQGKRTDLEVVKDLARSGATTKEIWDAATSYAAFRMGMAGKFIYAQHRTEKPEVVWLWGETGSGKTFEATEGRNYYMKDDSKWWDGYDAMEHDRIVIDDLNPQRWDIRNLLRLLDRYKYTGEIKNGHVKVNTPEIYITCDVAPEAIWGGKLLEQLLRRIDRVVHKCTEVPVIEGGTSVYLPGEN
jgi:hypothetical protein